MQVLRSERLIVLAVIGVLLIGACEGSDKGGYARPSGRGSAACRAWQKSFCDFAAVECGASTEANCVELYYGVTCLSDDVAKSCAEKLDSATCGTMPQGCNLNDVADFQPAITACNAYVAAVCHRQAECFGTVIEDCVAEAQKGMDCSKAVAYATGYEACIDDVAKLACTAAELPSACRDIIKLGL